MQMPLVFTFIKAGSSSSTANGNFANFADFEAAFSSSSVEKTG